MAPQIHNNRIVSAIHFVIIAVILFNISFAQVDPPVKNDCLVRWVKYNDVNVSLLEKVPPAGKEVYEAFEDGSFLVKTVFVVRVNMETTNDKGENKTGLIPGKFVHPTCWNGGTYYSYKGRQYKARSDDVEILVYPPGVLSWTSSINNPADLVIGGFDPLSPLSPYYICRFYHNKGDNLYLLVGKLDISGNCTAAISSYLELSNSNYEVLALNEYGKRVQSGDFDCHLDWCENKNATLQSS